MSVVAAAVIGSAAVGVYSANQASNAAEDAAATQADSAAAGIAEQRRQFDAIRELLQPYVNVGGTADREEFDAQEYLRQNPDVAADAYWGANPEAHYNQFGMREGRTRPVRVIAGQRGSLTGQQDLIGLNGAPAQQLAIDAIERSPMFSTLMRQGENAILQNASATGGLRGGNTQRALAEFRPNLLAALIDQQYSRLGGLTQLAQNSAAGVGTAGLSTGNNISNLLQQQGAAVAGGQLAGGAAAGGYASAINGALGLYAGLGGFRTPGTAGAGTITGGTGLQIPSTGGF